MSDETTNVSRCQKDDLTYCVLDDAYNFDLSNAVFYWKNLKLQINPKNKNYYNVSLQDVRKILLSYIKKIDNLLN